MQIARLKERTEPARGNMVLLFDRPDYTLYWKGRAVPKRKPKDWANLVVFMRDRTKRKRSFHISWNGGRFGSTPEFDVTESETGVLYDPEERLPTRPYVDRERYAACEIRETRSSATASAVRMPSTPADRMPPA